MAQRESDKKGGPRDLPVAAVNAEQGKALGEAFWTICNKYGLTRAQQAALLGLRATSRIKSLETEQEIPLEPDKFARVGLLLGIHKNLRIMFPENKEVVYAWMRTAREMFSGKSAIDWIMEDEIHTYDRLFTVRRRLDEMRNR